MHKYICSSSVVITSKDKTVATGLNEAVKNVFLIKYSSLHVFWVNLHTFEFRIQGDFNYSFRGNSGSS